MKGVEYGYVVRTQNDGIFTDYSIICALHLACNQHTINRQSQLIMNMRILIFRCVSQLFNAIPSFIYNAHFWFSFLHHRRQFVMVAAMMSKFDGFFSCNESNRNPGHSGGRTKVAQTQEYHFIRTVEMMGRDRRQPKEKQC